MTNRQTSDSQRDQLIKNLATLLAGLAVPVSMEMPLGKAGPAWTAVHQQLITFGWAKDEQYENALRSALGMKAATRV